VRPKVFIASAIDEDESRGMCVRERFGRIIEECGFEALGAGISGNPIVDVDSPISVCHKIIVADLLEQSRAQSTLVVMDCTPVFGTIIEAWEAYRQGQHLVVFVLKGEIKSIFLRGIVDEVIHTENELRASLSKLRRKYE